MSFFCTYQARPWRPGVFGGLSSPRKRGTMGSARSNRGGNFVTGKRQSSQSTTVAHSCISRTAAPQLEVKLASRRGRGRGRGKINNFWFEQYELFFLERR